MKRQIQSLEVSYLVHETEDGDRVEAAVHRFFGNIGEPTLDDLEGHFGNRIIRASHHITGEVAARAFETLVSNMDPELRRRIAAELGTHLDEHQALYLRFHKQRLLGGRLELTESDPVRVRVKPRAHTMEGGAERFFAGLLS